MEDEGGVEEDGRYEVGGGKGRHCVEFSAEIS